MEKLDSALCQWIVVYINYCNFLFFYFHIFYKTNNIETKPGAKVKTYIQIYHNKSTDRCSTLDPHEA